MPNEEEEDIPPAFEDPNQPAPQIKILNKRDTFSNAHHSTDEGYMRYFPPSNSFSKPLF